MTTLDMPTTEALAGDFVGELITPDHQAYDVQRRIWKCRVITWRLCGWGLEYSNSSHFSPSVRTPTQAGISKPAARAEAEAQRFAAKEGLQA